MAQTWLFTITFKGNYTCAQKYRKINKFTQAVSKFINFNVNKDVRFEYSIEYHKIKIKNSPYNGLPDPAAPHLHGVLTLNRLSNFSSEEIFKMLQKDYGKSQFFLCESDIKLQGWYEYSRKDVISNNGRYPDQQHWHDITVKHPPQDNFHEWDIDNALDL